MRSGLSLEFKPQKVQAVHFTNQIKYKTNTTKHDDGEWCSIVHCVTLKEIQTSHMKQAAVSRLNEKLVTHPFLSHNQKYLPNSKITQNLLLLVFFFFLILLIYLFRIFIYIYWISLKTFNKLMSRNNRSLCGRSKLFQLLTICTTISRHAAGFGHCYWRFFRPVCFVCCVMARCDCVYKTTAKRHQNNSGANTQSSSSKWHCQASLLRGEESREAVMNCVLSRFKGFLILWMGW